jgi:hypothetical protein
MGRSRKQRRPQHGSAGHWKQTDCWYYTAAGTKNTCHGLDENGRRIRGKSNQAATERAWAMMKVANEAERDKIAPASLRIQACHGAILSPDYSVRWASSRSVRNRSATRKRG